MNKFAGSASAPKVGDYSADFFVPWLGTDEVVMNAEFLAVLDFWEREKGISKEILVTAVEEALLALQPFGAAAEPLSALATYLLTRTT